LEAVTEQIQVVVPLQLQDLVDQVVEHLMLLLPLVVVVMHVKVLLVVIKDLVQTLVVEVVEQVLLEQVVERGDVVLVDPVEQV
jgi:hypothetical protein